MSTAGIITYHAAYNYGSVLQAYATQEALRAIGVVPEIIDYRPATQINYYHSLYRRKFGLKTFIKDATLVPVHRKRKEKADNFESFITQHLNLSAHQYREPNQLGELGDRYDTFISGSDQILNKHSNELESEDWGAMSPYYLQFAAGKKVSFSTSLANMTEADLEHLRKPLQTFSYLSAREPEAALALSHLTGKQVLQTLDPTLLFNSKGWNSLVPSVDLHLPSKYALYYTLTSTKTLLNQRPALKKISQKLAMPIVILSPFAFLPQSSATLNIPSAGPSEFVTAIRNASVTLTDSYHGTLFSLNFGIPFWSISSGFGSATRKNQILNTLMLSNRIEPDLEAIANKDLLAENASIQQEEYQGILSKMRSSSFSYLRTALLDSPTPKELEK